MFSKIPQRLTAPFGLLGDEAKLAFPTQPGGILKLATVRNISSTDSYWDQYFVLFDSPSDVFSLITPHHIRRALLDAPENVATLIRVTTSRLFNLISDHTFPSSPANTSVTAFASAIIKAGSSERNTTKEVLNCLRILQRVLPVIFEVEGESYAFELELLWKKEQIAEDEEVTDEPQFVIEDEDDIDSEHEDTTPRSPLLSVSANPSKLKKQLPSLGERLFSSLVDLLFCCGFTLPTKIQVDHYKINYVIWEKGVGSAADPGPSYQYDSNKTEVLRLLLVLLSRQIYVPPGSLFAKPSLYSLHVVQKTPRRDVLTLLCSLLNTAMNSRQSAESGISGITGKLPYNHLVFKGEDPRTNLVTMCLQVLCVLFDFQSGSAKDQIVSSGEALPTARTNAFRYFLMKLHRAQDLDFIMRGVIDIMEQHAATSNNLLPGAKKSIPYVPETVIFFWKMIELNKKFRSHVLESEMGMDLVAYFLCYFLEIKDKPQQHGVCRAISYIVQTLSAERSFGVKLSHPVKVSLAAKWNFGGNAADFLIMAIYSIVATTSGALNSLYPALIIALSNASPYFKNLSVSASTRLIQLLTSFSNPVFLLSDEGNPRLLFFMLEVFNSIVFHQLSSNPNVIYGILCSHKVFEDLGTFTLVRGLREIRRVQLAKEENARKQNLSKVNSAEESLSDRSAEKLKLLNSDSQDRKASASDTVNAETRSSQSHETGPGGDGILTTSLMSPTAEHAILSDNAPPPSEKARGKMRERRSSSADMSASLERIALTGVGRNGFIPTQEWVTSWQQGLPLDTVMLVISELLAKVQEIQSSRKANSTSAVMDFLSAATLSHVLPAAPPLNPRRFIWSDASIVWLTSLIWGEIYVRNMTPLGIWNSTNVRLFYVKHTTTQQRQITETVSSVVGGLLRRTSDSQARIRA